MMRKGCWRRPELAETPLGASFRDMTTRHALLAALFVAMPSVARAQADSASNAAAACASQKPGLVLNVTFTNPADFGRVVLCSGANYSAETNRGGVRLSAKALLPGVQSPRITEMLGANSGGGGGVGSGSTLYNLKAFADGVYEFRATSVNPGASVTLRITRK